MRYSLWTSIAFVFAAHIFFVPVTVGASDRSLPMRFELIKQGPADTCGQSCKIFIKANGAITADTPRDFATFTKGRDLTGATLVLDSDGGSVHGAMALGRIIRKLKLDTTIGRVRRLKTTDHTELHGTLSPQADCESMCAFVLLAGINRTVPPEARVMVHQIWLGDRREDPTAANYTAEDLVLVQRDIGRLAQYTAEMGISVDMLDLSLRIPPWEPMHALTREELARMRVVTAPDAASGALVAAVPPAPPAPLSQVTTGVQPIEISERRWEVVQNSGSSVLARRHPLTVEGDEIGSFDFMVACGGAPDSYDVSYVERRRYGELPTAINGVSMRVGGLSALLKVVSSERRRDTSELVTYAAGPVPSELIAAFAASGSHSMTIETKTAGIRTAIRLGNTGAQQSMPGLTASCGKPLGNRAELSAKRAGGVALAK